MTIEVLIILRPEHRNETARLAAGLADRFDWLRVEVRKGIVRGTMSELAFRDLPEIPEARVVEGWSPRNPP